MDARRHKNRNSASTIDEWARLLSLVLGRLSDLLIDADLPVSFLEELSRIEYARAAYVRARRPSGSVNRSKIAAITGLSRPEVTRLLSKMNPDRNSRLPLEPTSRSARVVSGWLSDPRFRKSLGVPAELPYAGGPNSFTHLAKAYAADVPPRALLERLQLLGLVSVSRAGGEKGQSVSMVQTTPRRASSRKNVIAITQLLECLSLADSTLGAPSLMRAEIPSGESTTQSVAIRAATEKAETFLVGIRESLSPAGRLRGGPGVRVVVAIAPVPESRKARRSPLKTKKARNAKR